MSTEENLMEIFHEIGKMKFTWLLYSLHQAHCPQQLFIWLNKPLISCISLTFWSKLKEWFEIEIEE